MEFEYRVITFPRQATRTEVKQVLTEAAEYAHWEVDWVRLYFGGKRKVRLKRRIIRVRRTV
ncbi:MAG: DUF5703 family protein [Dermatophilus congolensis]|nr:DUF5703 family protein [Dermatophilus congolensis]